MFGRAVWVKATSRRSKVWLLAGVFLLSAVLSPFVVSQPAYADTAGDIHDINYKHYAATYLRDCLFRLPDETKNIVLQARANASNRFLASSHKVGIGLYLEPTDGLAGCEEGGLVSTALQSLGYANNPGKLLTDIGYTVDRTTLGCNVENPACENGTQNRYTRPAGGDTFNTRFASVLNLQPDYARYVAYRSIFDARCKLVEPPTGSGSAVTYKKVVLGSDGNYITQDAMAEFAIENRGSSYQGEPVTFDTGRTPIKRFEYENKNTTCRELLGALDLLASHVADYNNKHKDDPITDGMGSSGDDTDCTAKPDAEGCGEDAPTCELEGVGWFVCPVMTLIAQLNDAAYGFLASHFLSVNLDLNGSTSPVRDAWAKFRDVANVLFVIAFLFVVYSQLTSVGISNYGIKKMLPKIVVAAILVNMSYLICQLAVDLSNILGYGLSQFFANVTVGTQVNGASTSAPILGTLTWAYAIGGILGGAVGIALGVSIPVLLSALLAIGLIVLILVARQALIILLITIAPVAFVAYLLPNTEQWFKKWVKMFSTLLLLFPIIALVFGASKLAGNIILSTAEKDPLMQVVALGVSALPFFVVPGLLKGALTAAGAIGTKLSGMADARTKSAVSAHKSKADERKKNSYIGRQLAERSKLRATRNAMIAGGTYSGKNPFHKARSKVFGAVNNNRLSGKAGDRIGTAGDMLEAKEWKEDVDAAAATFSIDKQPEIVKMAQSGVDASGKKVTDAMRAAAIEYTSKKGSIGEVASIDSKGADAKVRSAHQEAIRAKGLNNIAGNEVLKEIGQGGVNGDDVNRLIRERVEKGSMLATDLTQSESSAALVAGAVGSGGSNLSAAGKAKLQETVDTIANNESTRKAMSVEMKKQVRNMGATYTEPPTTSPAGGAPSGGAPSGAGGSGPTGGSGSSGSGSGSGGTP